MATTAALLTVSMTGAKSNHMSTSLEHKRKNQESLMSTRKEQPDQNDLSKPANSSASQINGINNEEREIRANGVRSNGTVSCIPMKKLKNQISSKPNVSSTSNSQSLTNKSSSPNDLSNSDGQPPEGKRKLSLSQYKEHKRLKSSDPSDSVSTDVDMRVYAKPPSPMEINDCSTIGKTLIETTISKNSLLDIGSNKKSNLTEPGLRNVVKKKVIWADERQQELVQTSFFEIDDCERMNKRSFAHQFENSISIAQIEKLEERNFRQQQSFQDFDDRPALPSLPPLIRIHLPSTLPNPVVKSDQRIIQEERERTVLQALLIGSFVPDSPAEPDSESTEDSLVETKFIPLEDDTSAKKSDDSQVITTSSSTTPIESNSSTSTNGFGSSSGISPQVAQILAVARGNLTSNIVNPQPNPVPTVTPPALPIQPTPNLLALLAGAQNANIPPINTFANLLSSLTLPMNSLANPWLPPINPILTNRLPMPPPLVQNQLPQTLPSSFTQPSVPPPSGSIDTSTSDMDSTRFNNFAHNQPSSNFPKKNFHHRGNPNHRKQHFRRGPANGQRRNLYSNRNAFA